MVESQFWCVVVGCGGLSCQKAENHSLKRFVVVCTQKRLSRELPLISRYRRLTPGVMGQTKFVNATTRSHRKPVECISMPATTSRLTWPEKTTSETKKRLRVSFSTARVRDCRFPKSIFSWKPLTRLWSVTSGENFPTGKKRAYVFQRWSFPSPTAGVFELSPLRTAVMLRETRFESYHNTSTAAGCVACRFHFLGSWLESYGDRENVEGGVIKKRLYPLRLMMLSGSEVGSSTCWRASEIVVVGVVVSHM